MQKLSHNKLEYEPQIDWFGWVCKFILSLSDLLGARVPQGGRDVIQISRKILETPSVS